MRLRSRSRSSGLSLSEISEKDENDETSSKTHLPTGMTPETSDAEDGAVFGATSAQFHATADAAAGATRGGGGGGGGERGMPAQQDVREKDHHEKIYQVTSAFGEM